VLGDLFELGGAHVLDGGAEADGALDVGRARLVAEGRLAHLEAIFAVVVDHAAADVPQLQVLETILAHVQDADARRAEDLVRREREEIAVELAHVDGQVRHRLRGVDHDRHAGGVGVAIHSSTGATTPVTLETCASVTSFVRGERRSLSCW